MPSPEGRYVDRAGDTRVMRMLAVASLALATSGVAHATESGLDLGWVVTNGEVVDAVDRVDSLGVDWVRINFRLDLWSAPTAEWFAAYDRVIDSYVARGYQVYGLLNDEAVASAHEHGSPEWIADFVANAVAIVDHFKDRVRVYEVINEPNDWAGGSSARFTPRQFAQILQDTYLEVKHHGGHDGDRCWQVDLVSGPLFSFDGTTGAEYLAETYAAGRSELAWDWTHEATGSYPLDGIGYHLYVAQGPESSHAEVRDAMHANLGAVWDVVAANEGGDSPKQLWVSEYGFRADALGDGEQAERLDVGFAAMRDFRDKVALGVYFTLNDFPDNAWGVFDAGGTRRPAADRLAQVAAANRPARGAAVTGITTPVLAPGELGDVVVTLENRGGAVWGANTRLGAAPGCPDAAAANELAWQPANGDDGYANGLGDARMFLPHDVGPGQSIELRIPVRAPDVPGTYRFAARMVDEGVAWFGSTAQASVEIQAPTAQAAAQTTSCAATSDASGALLYLFLAALLVARSRTISVGALSSRRP